MALNLLSQHDSWLNEANFKLRTGLALDWLHRAFEVTGQLGFAGYYQKRPWERGRWSNAYPETTGYIIETLLDYEALTLTGRHKALAMQAADWLLNIQLDNGAFQGGLIDSPSVPSVFNTGMVLFGLEQASREVGTINNPYSIGMAKATNWLLESMEADGSWQIGAYTPGHVPSYYTKVLWALLLSARHLNLPSLKEKVVRAIKYYHKRIEPDYFIRDCGFFPGKSALTHTLAYCLRGFFECAMVLNDEVLYVEAKSIATIFATLIIKHGKAAGEYDSGWRGYYHFTCLTGNCQLSIIFLKLFEKERDELFLTAALMVFAPVVAAQNISHDIDLRGTIPGSKPVWGNYFRFRYPNWGVKFYLDTYLYFFKNSLVL